MFDIWFAFQRRAAAARRNPARQVVSSPRDVAKTYALFAVFAKAALVFVAVVALAMPSFAATRRWTGSSPTNVNWTTPQNWLGNVAPVAGDDLVFPGGLGPANAISNNNDFPDGTAFNSLYIDGSTTAGDVVLNGNRIALGAGGLTFINSATAPRQIDINFPITVSSFRPFVASGSSGSLFVRFNGVISGAGAVQFQGEPTAKFILRGVNTYSGGTLSNAAQLILQSNSALGTGNYQGDGASVLEFTGQTITNNLSIAGGSNGGVGALRAVTNPNNPNTVNGSITNIGTGLVKVFLWGSDFTVNGPLIGSNPIDFSCTTGERVTLNADSPAYTGGLQITGTSDNEMVVNAVFANSGRGGNSSGRFGGTGRVSNVTMGNTQTLIPGAFSTGGTFTTNNLYLATQSKLRIIATAPLLGLSGKVAVTGTVVLGDPVGGRPILDLLVNYAPTVGQQLRIIDNDGADAVVGEFAGLPQGSLFTINNMTFSIDYAGGTGNDVVLTVLSVPPPQTLNVGVVGSGTGTVTGIPTPISCPGTCSTTQPYNTTVGLNAVATGGSVFTGWLGGGCTGTNPICSVTLDKTQNVTATFALPSQAPFTLNIDGSAVATKYDAATDGTMILRYLLGYRSTAITDNAVGASPTRTSNAIETYLIDLKPKLDVDGDGEANATTDGLMIVRFLLGITDATLSVGAIGSNATLNLGLILNRLSTLTP